MLLNSNGKPIIYIYIYRMIKIKWLLDVAIYYTNTPTWSVNSHHVRFWSDFMSQVHTWHITPQYLLAEMKLCANKIGLLRNSPSHALVLPGDIVSPWGHFVSGCQRPAKINSSLPSSLVITIMLGTAYLSFVICRVLCHKIKYQSIYFTTKWQ